MEFQKLSSPSLKELFIEQLEHMILSGKLKIGEKLPPERQLAEMMQVSRAVVNAGISELEKKLNDYEDKWYSKFSKMETALAKLQSNSSAVTSLLGGS